MKVSIQLVSPASGEAGLSNLFNNDDPTVSIQLVSPASGEGEGDTVITYYLDQFPFN